MDNADDQPVRDDVPEEPGDGVLAAEEPLAAKRGNVPLAILASLAIAAIGVALWGVLAAKTLREYVGISVVVGLIVGYVMRELTRRSTIGVRLIASVITALTCVAGSVVGEVAYLTSDAGAPFWRHLRDNIEPDAVWASLERRNGIQLAVFAAAVVIAFAAAGPKKEPAPKKRRGDTVDLSRDDSGDPPPVAAGE